MNEKQSVTRVGSGAWLGKCVFLIPLIAIVCVVYGLCNSLNPDSWWCLHKIYKQPDGTYQVWWSCRTRHIEGTFATYDDAKAYQVKECNELKAFMSQSPTGERTK